jgi:hypothetical protein
MLFFPPFLSSDLISSNLSPLSSLLSSVCHIRCSLTSSAQFPLLPSLSFSG